MSASPEALQPVALQHVTIDDAFWSPRVAVNRQVTIPHEYRMCK